MSPGTVKHSAAAFTQVDDKSRSPHVKYAIVWQVVKVPLAHAQNRSRADSLNDFKRRGGYKKKKKNPTMFKEVYVYSLS